MKDPAPPSQRHRADSPARHRDSAGTAGAPPAYGIAFLDNQGIDPTRLTGGFPPFHAGAATAVPPVQEPRPTAQPGPESQAQPRRDTPPPRWPESVGGTAANAKPEPPFPFPVSGTIRAEGHGAGDFRATVPPTPVTVQVSPPGQARGTRPFLALATQARSAARQTTQPGKSAPPTAAIAAKPEVKPETAAPAVAGAAAPSPSVQSLAEEPPATPEAAKTQDRLDAASPGPPAESDAAEPSTGSPTPEDTEAEPEATAPPPTDAASQPAQQAQRLEQAGREHSEAQRDPAREAARAETPAETAAQKPPEGEPESAELSAEEKAASLAAVGEDVGGGESAPGGGGSGGGGGGAAPEPAPAAPDTAAMAPEDGLGAAAQLPVGAAVKALGGVGSAVDQDVQAEGTRLQASMPEIEVGGDGGSAVKPLATGNATTKTPRSLPPNSQPVAKPKPLPEPPPAPTQNLPAPRLAPTADGALSAADAQRVQASILALPTTDPGLEVTAGPPPRLSLAGDADPAQIADQKDKLAGSVAAQTAQGRAEVAVPAGEDDIRVRRPKETLKAKAPALPAGGAGSPSEDAAETLAIIAEAKQGNAVRAAIGQAQAQVAAKQAGHRAQVAEQQAQTRQQLDQLQEDHADQQNEARRQARAEVAQARADWTADQQREVAQADAKTQAELTQGEARIGQEQKQADAQASAHIEAGERQALRHRRDAESQAGAKKREAEGELKGVFGWLADKAAAFFDRLKQGLTAIFDAAKRLVRAAIDRAKQLAVAVIEKARAAVVALIRAVGAALVAIGDALLAAFPTLRAKWRAYIESKVKAAEDRVNQLADSLKRGVQKLLDRLGQGLESLLAGYQHALLAALDATKAAALGAIKSAQAVADTLGAFAAIVKDIAQNPGAWLGKLATAVKDGIQHHLWQALSGAVKQWFNDKLDAVLGMGAAVWGVLKQGGLALKAIAAMVWQGLKQAIPSALIGLLVEKLVAMIVPAAGAVMVVVEGIQAAWGSAQRILAAVSQFVEFLKAVKTGGGAPRFAALLAAAAVAVVDFVSNWLLKKLRGPAAKIGDKIKAIAKKILDRVKNLAKRAGRWLKGKFKQPGAKLKGWKQKFDAWRKKRKDRKDQDKDKEQEKRERLKKAVEAIRPQILAMAGKGGIKSLLLRAKLLGWRIKHRLSKLELVKSGRNIGVRAVVNPTEDVIQNWVELNLGELRKMIQGIAEDLLDRPEVQAAFDEIKRREKPIHAEPESPKPTKSAPLASATAGFDGSGQALALALRQRGAKPHAPYYGADRPSHPPKPGSSLAMLPAKDDPAAMRVTQNATRAALGRPGAVVFRDALDEGKSYPEFVKEVRALQGKGIADTQMARQAANILRGDAAGGPPESRGLAAAVAVMVGVEGGRSDRALVMMPELLRTAAEGKGLAHLPGPQASLTLAQALETANPVSPGGAVRAMHEIDKAATGKTVQKDFSNKYLSPEQKAATGHVDRTDIQYFAHVTALKLGGAAGLVGKSEAEIKAMLEQKNFAAELRGFILARAEAAHGLDRFREQGDPKEEG